jgi:hypothetical protein
LNKKEYHFGIKTRERIQSDRTEEAMRGTMKIDIMKK